MEAYEAYIGQIFDRRYKIEKVIGIGGMAVVFEAYDALMKRVVAVKILKEECAHDPSAVKRFVNESKAVAMLSHPNIVNIFDVSVSDRLKYIVMERVEGITLKSYMTKKGALSIEETLSFTEQILRALVHAHSKGIIHRDIKPQNIMLLKNGKIKVADFGIAKLPNADTLTVTDKAIGTVYYVSPEQASGKPIDQRSDLYSLGVLMYEMLTAKLPFEADSPVSVALMQVNTEPKPPRSIVPTITPGLEEIILIAMSKNPDDRFQSASQMLRHIMQSKANPAYVPKKIKSAPHKAELPTDEKKKKNQSKSIQPIILGVVAGALLVMGITAGVIISSLAGSGGADGQTIAKKTIEISDYVGKELNSDLEKEIGENFCKIVQVDEYSAEYPAGTIIGQDPISGETRKVTPGDKSSYCALELTVSLGAEKMTMPDFSNMSYHAVENKLRKMGLIPEEEYAFDENTMIDYVISTVPSAGTEGVTAGGTVKLIISKGQEYETTVVPDFLNMTQKEAYEALVAAGLSLGYPNGYVDSAAEAGRVVSQSIIAGTEVAKKTRITFTLSNGELK